VSAKTKIVVLQLKELIYTGIFILLGIFLILLLVFMFLPRKEEGTLTEPVMKYVAGVYQTSITLNNASMDLEVVLDSDTISSIRMVPLEESVSAMYPLVEPSLDSIAAQIYETQSLDNITYSSQQQFTSMLLLDAIEDCLEKAAIP
jgi:uncharacterized protein with FMN-binding domain